MEGINEAEMPMTNNTWPGGRGVRALEGATVVIMGLAQEYRVQSSFV